MKEEHWYRMLVISLALHVIIVGGFGIPFKKAAKKLAVPYYSVNLVGDFGSPGQGRMESPAARGKESVEKAAKPAAEKLKKVEPKKAKPAPVVKQKEPVRTLAPKKTAPKETPTTRDDVKSVAEKIKEMKKRAEYAQNSGEGRAGPGRPYSLAGPAGGGGGRPMDPVLLRYLKGVQDRVQAAWHIPLTVSKKGDLETVVTIRVRRDGRISDITVDKRSGNRIYDESVMRILRSLDLPPLPASMEDPFEIELHCRPEGVA